MKAIANFFKKKFVFINQISIMRPALGR